MQNAQLVLFSVPVLLCAVYTLLQLLNWDMRPQTLASWALPLAAAQNTTIDLSWHAPNKTWINDLSQVLNSNDTHGFYFGGSVLPPGTPYATYNWCNMPHVRRQEYLKASEEYSLEYVEV